MNLKKMTKGFTLVEMLVVIAIISILAASLFPAISSAMDMARATALKTKGKGIWNAIRVANSEREPLGKSSLWPVDVASDYSTSSEKYFQYLLSDGNKSGTPVDSAEDRLVEDLSYDSLSAQGVPTAATASEFTDEHMAWRVCKVNENTPGELPFLVTKNINEDNVNCNGSDDETKISLSDETKPFGNKRAVWITIGGASKDARRKYFDYATFMGGCITNIDIIKMK